MSEAGRWGARHGAIALASCALLIYEIAITRVLSVTVGYHFAFLSISLAMLGIAVPGVAFALRPPSTATARRALYAAAVAAPGSIALLFAVGVLLPRPRYRVPELSDLFQANVVLAIAGTLATMLALGTAIGALLILARADEVPKLYAADLAGAAVGALVVVPAMIVLPTPHLIALSALLPLLGVVLLERALPRAAIVLAGLLVASLVWGEPYRLRYTKGYVEDKLLWSKWTPTARIAVFPHAVDTAFGWGMGTRFAPQTRDQLWLEQDGGAGTPITRVTGSPGELDHLLYDVTSVGYQVRPPKRVLVIGAGGGRDVLSALLAGATEVDAVELNPAIVEAVSDVFGEFSGDLYRRPGVRSVIAEGRSFLSRSPGNYDLIQISLIDSYSATSGGAYALSENFLYTAEALDLYLDKLAPEGVLSISRYGAGLPKMEMARLVPMARTAVERSGVARPLDHVVVVQADQVATLLVSKRPWTPEELSRIDGVDATRGFYRTWPVAEDTPEDAIVPRIIEGGPTAFESVGFDLRPATDDRPFFFQTLAVLRSTDPRILRSLSGNESSVLLLRRTILLVVGLALALLALPFAATRRLPRGPGIVPGSIYFACIGWGFMLVETAWVQRFVLYLGHPSHATTVVLACLLVGAGLGALSAGRFAPTSIARWAPIAPIAIAAVQLLSSPLFRETLSLAMPARVAVSVLLLVPSGFLLGFAFPVGVATFGRESLAWFWAVNGLASVVAAVSSLALAMAFGVSRVTFLGVAFYVGAWLVLALRVGKAERQASFGG